ncbi:hypothetical protein RAB80_014056 [Fusarium oxysporum f. sp. vasinfectum]|nr:hypothetical protein RAB80_014056 [Fusarium oxysporum f. sp. vasinfectum]
MQYKDSDQNDQQLAAQPRLRTPGTDFSPQFNYSSDIRPREDRLASTSAIAADIMRDALEVDGLLLLDASHSHRSPRVESGCDFRTNANESLRNTQKTHDQLDADDWCPVLGSSVTAEAKQDGNSYFGHSTFYASTLKNPSDATNEGPMTVETGELSPHDSGYTPGQHHIRQEFRKAVMTLLPDVTSVAFFPIWNAQKRRWFAGGFAYSNNASRVFSPRRELSYLRALGTILMAEVSFIKEREVELSKLDVLDSISHERRSPRVLCSSWNNSVKAGMMSIASDVDLPLLIGDVIESVHVGHEFQKLSHGQTVQISDLPRDHVKIVANLNPV